MIIGGIAVIARGVQRMTTDIDAVIRGDAIPIRQLLSVLDRHDIAPRIDEPERFAEENLVLLTRHRLTEVDLDLSLGWTRFEHEALAASTLTRYGTVQAPIAGVDDLIVFKAMAGRSRDVDDAVTLLTLYPDVDLETVRRRVRELAELAGAPELVQGLDGIVKQVEHTSASRKQKKRVVRRPGPKSRK